ncbi:MAG: cobalamin-binding protein [Lachnospiraceae bacterium]|nr:cobalamin-binding protein [Lachnospiraceae bacterium]
MENTLEEIADALKNGRCKKVKDLVRMAVQEGHEPGQILEKGLLKGMEDVGKRFEKELVEIPEILSITRALNGGVDALKEMSQSELAEKAGTVLIGTMRGDVHDMGKNLVRIMLESKGLRVVDLGVDVPAHRFVDAAVHENAEVIVCSGFLQESVADMKRMVEEFEGRGIRQEVYIMVGGAALNEERALRIGADCYTQDAVSCGEKAYSYCKKKRRKRERYPKYLKENLFR